MTHIWFNTSCQICGRRLLVKIDNLGAEMRCPHCQGAFIARDSTSAVEDQTPIINRFDTALQRTASATSYRLSWR